MARPFHQAASSWPSTACRASTDKHDGTQNRRRLPSFGLRLICSHVSRRLSVPLPVAVPTAHARGRCWTRQAEDDGQREGERRAREIMRQRQGRRLGCCGDAFFPPVQVVHEGVPVWVAMRRLGSRVRRTHAWRRRGGSASKRAKSAETARERRSLSTKLGHCSFQLASRLRLTRGAP